MGQQPFVSHQHALPYSPVATILCLDDEPRSNAAVATLLEELGHTPVTVGSVPAAFQELETGRIDLLITDHAMPGVSGLDFLRLLREDRYDIPVILLTAYATVEQAVGAIKLGAVNYLAKPITSSALQTAVTQALEIQALRRQVDALRAEVAGPTGSRPLLGTSAPFRKVLRTVAAVAPSRASVLITGESGTGKELIARAIHDQSDRSDRPFISVNCAAIPEGLIESALFGHEKGAFTGAIRQTAGAFERADRGTLLLDEIAEMRLDLQAKLLRVLQEMAFERVGGTRTLQVDVRVLATTNRPLSAEVEAGRFRQDLFYRINTITLPVPPLRDRPDDIPALALHFMLRASTGLTNPPQQIDPEAITYLQSRRWRGNIRQLQHAVERAVLLATGPVLTKELFAPDSESDPDSIDPRRVARIGPRLIVETFDLAEAEAQLIERALTATNGNRSAAARLLGIHVRTLRRKLNDPPEDDASESPDSPDQP